MSCQLKRPNPEKFGPPPRSAYDQRMIEAFDPNSNSAPSYHAPVWPPERTKQDDRLQKQWCPKCKSEDCKLYNGCKEGYQNGTANQAAYLLPRSKFDEKLQNHWCPKCSNTQCGLYPGCKVKENFCSGCRGRA